jgi:HD-like signal output (HDOD) protein
VISVQATGVAARDRALRSLDRLPPFSPVLNRLVATMAREDVAFAELAELIEKDTVLAANVLRVVNSALYSFQGTVNSVRHAVAIMGLVKLRNLGLSLSVSRMWTQIKTPPGWSSARFNLHSVAAGVLSDLIAPLVETEYPEGAFVAGLLHDVGKLLIAIGLPSEYLTIRRLVRSGRDPIESEAEVLGTSHAELSALALEKWNLPEPIRRAARFHHNVPNGDAVDLGHLVWAADRIANDLGHSVMPPADGPAADAPPLEMLGLAPRMPALIEQFYVEFDALKSFF